MASHGSIQLVLVLPAAGEPACHATKHYGLHCQATTDTHAMHCCHHQMIRQPAFKALCAPALDLSRKGGSLFRGKRQALPDFFKILELPTLALVNIIPSCALVMAASKHYYG